MRIRLLRNATYWLTPQSPEPEILALFLALHRVFEPDVFWDVGANIGIYGWLMKTLNHNVHVTMLEPDPINCDLLEQTRRRMPWLRDVVIRQVAASSHGGVVGFALDQISSATGSVISAGRTFSEKEYGVIPATIQAAALFLVRAVRWYRNQGITVDRVLTDNGNPCRSGAWRRVCRMAGLRHRRTRPYHPQTNGKAERWIQTAVRECLYLEVFHSSEQRLAGLQQFIRWYNLYRPHRADKGLSPSARLAQLQAA